MSTKRDIKEVTVEFLDCVGDEFGDGAAILAGLAISGLMLSIFESKNAGEALGKFVDRMKSAENLNAYKQKDGTLN